MIIVIVEHYLNQEGKSYFPSWLKSVRTKLKKWSGFIRIELLKGDDKARCILYLEFCSREGLNLWGLSIEHSEMLNNLSKFSTKKHYSRTYEVVN